jgi:DNA-binding transcriptional LysR family regulator
MPHQINLRQVEAFKAVIETGTISRAADVLHITQPAVSKLIAHFEMDTGLKLFDRHNKRRLAPTDQGMSLYDAIDRIFTGLRQVESAVDEIRRAEQGRLSIGVLPALSGSFVQKATSRFLGEQPNVFCSILARSSQFIVDWVVAGKVDIGIVSEGLVNPYVTFEPLLEQPMVCIMPVGHPLAKKRVIEPKNLNQVPFISYPVDSGVGHRIHGMLQDHNVEPQIVLVANWANTVSEFVASGLGVSLIHPLSTINLRDEVVIRRFKPEIFDGFQMCRSAGNRNAKLVELFAEYLRAEASKITSSMMAEL